VNERPRTVRITLRVQPRSHRTAVGGGRDGALVVRVTAPAVDGRATEAALASVADALGVARRQVSLLAGATSRVKVVEVEGDPDELQRRVAALIESGGGQHSRSR